MDDNSTEAARSKRLFIILTVVGIALMVAVPLFVDLERLHGFLSRLDAWLVFLALAVLPLVAVPVSILYVVAGAKFGPAWGLVVSAAAIALHITASWWIARSWLNPLLTRLLKKARIRIPQVPPGEYVPICLLVALIPGVSYTAKNYLLVLSGVPFRPLFWTCLPAHFFHATLAVLFGDFTGAMTPPKIAFLVVYGVVLTWLSHRVVKRLKARRKVDLAPAS